MDSSWQWETDIVFADGHLEDLSTFLMIDVLIGRTPEEYGVSNWHARRLFLQLTYELLNLANGKEKISIQEVNRVRKLSVLWGRCFLLAGYDSESWTFYFHTLHEHLHWELNK